MSFLSSVTSADVKKYDHVFDNVFIHFMSIVMVAAVPISLW